MDVVVPTEDREAAMVVAREAEKQPTAVEAARPVKAVVGVGMEVIMEAGAVAVAAQVVVAGLELLEPTTELLEPTTATHRGLTTRGRWW